MRELGLSDHEIHLLETAGIHTKEDLANALETELLNINGVGETKFRHFLLAKDILNEKYQRDRIIQVSGFGVENTITTQCNYMLVALTDSGKVLMSTGDKIWTDVSPEEDKEKKE